MKDDFFDIDSMLTEEERAALRQERYQQRYGEVPGDDEGLETTVQPGDEDTADVVSIEDKVIPNKNPETLPLGQLVKELFRKMAAYFN